MSGYTLVNTQAGSLQAMTTTYTGLVRAVAAASLPKRVRYVEMEFSTVSVPNSTDCQVQADLTYCGATTAGTGTAATPQPQDSGAAIGTAADAAVSTGVINFTNGAPPTTFVQANCWFNRGFNQRSGVLWQTQPGREIIQPSTASVGAVLRALSTNYTGNVVAKLIFDEL